MIKRFPFLMAWLFSLQLFGAPTIVQFESGSYANDGTGFSWVESDFRLRAGVYAPAIRSPQESGWPKNGVNSYIANFPRGWTPLVVSNVSGALFNAFTVDLAEYSTLFHTPKTIPFVGIKMDLSTVAVTFVTDGIVAGNNGNPYDFQTFTFPSNFTDLVALTVNTDAYAMDNLVLSIVPEPGIAAYLGFAGAALFLGRNRRLPCGSL